MTATPHAGREEDFQLFLALLDTDRFEGRYRDAVHTVNTDGLMRRMVKEDLKTFDGRPLFPERRAYTVAYQLSDAEQDLYEAVTQYVREEMNQRRQAQGGRRPQARRHRRLRAHGSATPARVQPRGHPEVAGTAAQAPGEAQERAALRRLQRRGPEPGRPAPRPARQGPHRVRPERLRQRRRRPAGRGGRGRRGRDRRRRHRGPHHRRTRQGTAILADLTELAAGVRRLGTDKKWTELRELLDDNMLATRPAPDPTPEPPKIIIFTEHRDTLEYLAERIRDLLGRSDAVVTIHGGVRREERRRVTELFTQDIDTRVLSPPTRPARA